jgi:shikimate kinase
MKIWLIGMMGSGKTSAGEIAAGNLGVPFIDTDRVVEQRTGESLSDLWSRGGEEFFRDVERTVVEELASEEGIVATGGGVVLHEGNRRLLADSGTVVWLRAEPAAIVSRVAASSDRPLLAETGDRAGVIEEKLRERLALYESIADHRIETDDLSPTEVASEIEALWKF